MHVDMWQALRDEACIRESESEIFGERVRERERERERERKRERNVT